MKTTLYLVRQAATEANLAGPARLQGRRRNPPLARLGVRQAELTRDFLAVRPLDACYASPMLRAVETARIIAEPHGLAPTILEGLNEWDVGDWDGLDWQTVHYLDAEGLRRTVARPGRPQPPAGESFAQLQARVTATLDELFERHPGQAALVVAHRLVHLAYLARVLHMTAEQAEQVQLDNCGVSVVVREGRQTAVNTLNASFHLQGAA
jgi:broad specificity phosphatase PhoE